MSDTPVSLASLMTPSKTVSIEFPGLTGLKVMLCYLAREELVKLRKRCVTNKFNKKTILDPECGKGEPIGRKLGFPRFDPIILRSLLVAIQWSRPRNDSSKQ